MIESNRNHKLPNVIAVTGGKGGVGKTSISTNLALSLARSGKHVCIIDGDVGLANVEVLLGLKPKKSLADVFENRCILADIVISAQYNLKVIPSSSHQLFDFSFTSEKLSLLQAQLTGISEQLDFIIVDTAAGVSNEVINFLRIADETIIVVSDEPTSISDAYKLLKSAKIKTGNNSYRILANMVDNDQAGKVLFEKLCNVSDEFLNLTLQYLGSVPFDDCARQAVKKRKPLVVEYPLSKSARSIISISENLMKWKSKQRSEATTSSREAQILSEPKIAEGIA